MKPAAGEKVINLAYQPSQFHRRGVHNPARGLLLPVCVARSLLQGCGQHVQHPGWALQEYHRPVPGPGWQAPDPGRRDDGLQGVHPLARPGTQLYLHRGRHVLYGLPFPTMPTPPGQPPCASKRSSGMRTAGPNRLLLCWDNKRRKIKTSVVYKTSEVCLSACASASWGLW